MNKFINKFSGIVSIMVSVAFTVIPERIFEIYKISSNISDEGNIIINHLLFVFIIIILAGIVTFLHMVICKKVTIKGRNYIIQVEYGDLYKIKKCKKVINFDECFTTVVGENISEIKPKSICGQYLLKNPNLDIEKLIKNIELKPAKTRSKFENKVRYEAGKIVPNGDDLLMAFARLDEDGRGVFYSYEEFLKCLSTLWEEIDKYYAQKDVCIPVLGAGLTRINGISPTQQELVDIIIMSYKLSTYKIKSPYKLRIVCKRNEDFSLYKIGENL